MSQQAKQHSQHRQMQWLQADQKTSESRRGAGTSWLPCCKAPTAPKPQGATSRLGQMPPQHMAHCKHTLFSLSYTQYLSGSIKLVTKKLFYSLASTHTKRLNAVRCHSGVQYKIKHTAAPARQCPASSFRTTESSLLKQSICSSTPVKTVTRLSIPLFFLRDRKSQSFCTAQLKEI